MLLFLAETPTHRLFSSCVELTVGVWIRRTAKHIGLPLGKFGFATRQTLVGVTALSTTYKITRFTEQHILGAHSL